MNNNNNIEWLPAMPFVTFVTFWIFWDTFHFVDGNWMKYRYYIIQKDIYMYTYMSICIYIKQKNTVCHIWFMCNTFSGCLKLVVSSTLLCWGNSSCAMLLDVAWSWRKDNVTSTFLTYLSYLSPSEYTGHTHSHRHKHTRWLSSLPTNFTGDLFPKDVSWCDWLPHAPLTWLPLPQGLFSPHAHTSVPLQLNTHTIMYLLLILTFLLLNGLFLVFHSMACAFFLLFLRIWMSMPHWKKNDNYKKEEEGNK